jgi:hypothetical protein
VESVRLPACPRATQRVVADYRILSRVRIPNRQSGRSGLACMTKPSADRCPREVFLSACRGGCQQARFVYSGGMEQTELGTPRTRNLLHRVEVKARKAKMREFRAMRAKAAGLSADASLSKDRSLAGKKRIKERKAARRG